MWPILIKRNIGAKLEKNRWWKNKSRSSYLIVLIKRLNGNKKYGHLFFIVLLLSCLPANASQKNKIFFDIPEQKADQALIEFAEQASMTFIFPFEKAEKIYANKLQGAYFVSKAIDILLQETGLVPKFNSNGVLSIEAINQIKKGSAMKITKKNFLAQFISAVSLTLLGGVSVASESSGTRGLVIEEVIVTANKRAESVQDVAISVTAMTGGMLENLGFQDVIQITQQVPNFTSQSIFGSSGLPWLNIRGVSFIDYTDANESSVGLVVDEVYHGAQGAAAGQLFDVERVEVLRGPQGTLFGRNTTGGLVHYITRKPGDKFEGYANVQAGSNNQVIIEVAAGGPVTDNFGVRLALKSNKDDGFQKNKASGKDFGATDVFSGRLTGVLDVTEDLSITANYHYADSESEMTGYGLFGTHEPSDNTTLCSLNDIFNSKCVTNFGSGGFKPNPKEVYANTDNPANYYTAKGGLINIEWDLGFATLTSISAFEEFEREVLQEFDASADPVDQRGYYTLDFEQFTQEIRLTGNSELVQWVTGLYYYDDDRGVASAYQINGVSLLASSSSLATTSMAVFAQADIQLSDRWALVLGGRYTDEEREINDLETLFSGFLAFSHEDDLSTEKFTYKASLEFRPSDNILTYLQHTTGFKSGGFNPALVLNAGSVGPVGEETVSSFELGAKTTWLDGRLILNAALFHYDFEDYQIVAGTIVNGVITNQYLNAGDASIYGSEFELTYLFNEYWDFTLGLGTLNTEFKNTDAVLSGQELDGNELPSAPSYSANGIIAYHMPLGNAGELTLQTSFNYQDDIWLNPANIPIAHKQEAYGIVNFRAIWVDEFEALKIEVFVDNAFDEEFSIHKFYSPGFDFAYSAWGRPRMAGAKVSYSF